MYRTIVVPLDGSTAAEQALSWALTVAEKNSASLHLVRVHVPPTPIMVGSELAADVVLDDAIRKSESGYFVEIVKRVGAVTKIPVQYSLLEGAVADGILDHALAIKADLLILTSHGRGAFARFWLGSVADRLMRHSTIPTLIVRVHDDKPADLNARPPITQIVIPLDGSPLGERVVEPAIRLGKATGAEFALVMVLDAVENIEAISERKIKASGGWFPEATMTKAEGYLETVAHRMRGHSVVVHKKVIEHGSAAGAILDYAKTHGHPLIALATHGHSGLNLKRLFIGSVADKIIRGAEMPVLVFHPADAAKI